MARVTFHIMADIQDNVTAETLDKLSQDLASHVRAANFVERVLENWKVSSEEIVEQMTTEEMLREGRY